MKRRNFVTAAILLLTASVPCVAQDGPLNDEDVSVESPAKVGAVPLFRRAHARAWGTALKGALIGAGVGALVGTAIPDGAVLSRSETIGACALTGATIGGFIGFVIGANRKDALRGEVS